MAEIGMLFETYEWAAEQVDAETWRATFSTERDEEYDLYVMAGATTIHFAVSPFALRPNAACAGRVTALLLRLNQQMPLVYFGIDDDEDINLLADLPRSGLNAAAFAAIVDALYEVTEHLAYEVRRTAQEPDYYSPALGAA